MPLTLSGYDPARMKGIARLMLFYRPGEEGVKAENVHRTWEDLYGAFQITRGPVSVVVDNEHGAPYVPSGYWDFAGRAIVIGAHGRPTLAIHKDAHLLNVQMFSRVELKLGKKKPRESATEIRDQRSAPEQSEALGGKQLSVRSRAVGASGADL